MQSGCFLPQITKLSSPARELESRAFLTPELKLLTLSLDAYHKIPNLRDGIEKKPTKILGFEAETPQGIPSLFYRKRTQRSTK